MHGPAVVGRVARLGRSRNRRKCESPSGRCYARGLLRLYSVLWTYARGRRARMVLALVLLVAAQVVRLAIPWLFGSAVNALQAQGADGLRRAAWVLAAMMAAPLVAMAVPGP